MNLFYRIVIHKIYFKDILKIANKTCKAFLYILKKTLKIEKIFKKIFLFYLKQNSSIKFV